MVVYLILYLLLIFIAIQSFNKTIKGSTYWIGCSAIFIVSALRAKTVGTDTFMYVDLFLHEDFEVNIELGFKFLIKLTKFFTNNYHVFIFVASAFQLIPLYLFIKKASFNNTYSLLIFVLGGFFLFYLSGLRQSIATSFVLLSLYYFWDKKYWICFITFLIATQFHTTSYIVLPIAAIAYYKEIKYKYAVILLIGSSFIGFFDLLQIRKIIELVGHSELTGSIDITERYRGYGSYKEDVTKGPLKLLWDMLPNTLLCYFLFKITKDKKHFFRDFFFIGVVISNLFITFSINSRISFYSLILQIVLVPNIFSYLKDRRIYDRVYISYLTFFFFYTIYIAYIYGMSFGRNDIVPYNFLFE